MTRTLVAALVSTLLALAPFGAATPARAGGNDDLKKILGGVATVIILGATIKNLRDRNRQPDPVPVHRDRHDPPRQDRPRHGALILPSDCLREADTRYGPRLYYAGPCLRHRLRNAHLLPDACAFTVQGHGRAITGYAPRCLRDYGWRRG